MTTTTTDATAESELAEVTLDPSDWEDLRRTGHRMVDDMPDHFQEAGVAVPSGTTVRGRYAIRVANVNHRSKREDFDSLVAAVVQYGRDILGA